MALPKYSKNPEDWFINCSNPICEEKIIYTNRNSFTQAAKKVKDGQSIKCRSCAASGYKHTDEAKEKMSNRVYSEESRKKNGERTRERYANMTEEERKEVSETQRLANEKRWEGKEEEKKQYFKDLQEKAKNISEEKKALKAQRISEANTNLDGMNHDPETWKVNCTDCEAEIKFEKYHQFQNAKSGIKKGKKKLCPNCKVKNLKVIKTDNPEDWVKKCCDCDNILKYSTFESYRTQLRKEIRCQDCVIKMVNNGYNRPNYNKDTIPYIVDILNVRYETEFIHAESTYGEYYIIDYELKTKYFADAYSEELNMWIEFDEPAHFRKGILREECQHRENRIRELIPDVIINRIYFNKKHHNINRTTK